MSESAPDASVSDITHELAGVLSSILGLAEIAEHRPDHPQRDQFIAQLHDEARRGARTIKDLQLARAIEAGPLAVPVNLAETVSAASNLLIDFVAEDGLDIASPSDLPLVRAEPSLLALVISRCFEVALALYPAASLSTTLKTEGRGVEVWISFGALDGYDTLRSALEVPQGELRPLALARAAVQAWGGSARAERTATQAFLVLQFLQFSSAAQES